MTGAHNGAYTLGGKKFDIGNTSAHAISRYCRGCTPALCGSNKMNENCNGSLMRILDGYELKTAIREGIHVALDWYGSHNKFQMVLYYWEKLSDPDDLASLPNEIIYSGGYVVETMETVLWALMNTDNYRDCVLTCVNMGYDADSTAAIAGGLAGLYYGYGSIPTEWVDAIVNRELIDE